MKDKEKPKKEEKKSQDKKDINKGLKTSIEKIIKFLDATAEIKTIDNGYAVNITSTNSGLLIGRFGQTLLELQYLLRMVANKAVGERVTLTVDVENYKANKTRELEELAVSVAENVSKSGYPQTLRPMNSYERKIIHQALNDFPGVETNSVGDEPARCIEVKAKSKQDDQINR